ncbi:hypothetical protein FA15DRAFT_364806 [Coprinopsis marcescibilis]|uniref:Chromatin modification-related protein n=1 Tax=Coprinopsis marcescibilis TaxID=230819 RepID=A0A5C3KXB2_COPMA|nr:hypothetical protein FA15DRAFT_364806 [Coprinopsis marcescibilis]
MFISSLGIDNLPAEVSHILQEIQLKDTRVQGVRNFVFSIRSLLLKWLLELQTEIDKDSSKYIRHYLRQTAPIPRDQSPKSAVIPGKISAAYLEIHTLATEKQELAEKLIELIERTRTRLDIELNKVRVLQGEPVVESYSTLTTPIATTPVFSPNSEPFKNPALAVTESLRNALAAPIITEPRPIQVPQISVSSAPTAPGTSPNKRRKMGTGSPSIKVPGRSASPTSIQVSGPQSTHQRSRLSRQIHPPVRDDDEELEAEVEEEVDDGDDRLYCYCERQSFGDMIACDNEGECPHEWFHLSCTNIKGPTPERWYCDDCKDKVTQATRKGRKK